MQVTVQCVPSRLSKEYGSALAGIRTLNESAVASRCSFTFGGSSRRRSVWQQTWIFTCQSLSYLCIYRCHYLVHTLSFFQNVRESISPSTTICEMGTKSWKWGGSSNNGYIDSLPVGMIRWLGCQKFMSLFQYCWYIREKKSVYLTVCCKASCLLKCMTTWIAFLSANKLSGWIFFLGSISHSVTIISFWKTSWLLWVSLGQSLM